VLWLVLRHALILLGIGVGMGAVFTAASGRLLAAFLSYRVNGYDALIGVGIAVLLTVCGMAASYFPARRAARIDPVVALRTE
jgi:ABC-type antimicrobial peptide transport system permease subunit